MKSNFGRVCDLAAQQYETVAVWQMREALKLSRGEIRAVVRRLTKVFHGVYATEELSRFGWYRAATLALGPNAVLSHLSALILLGLRPYQPSRIHVSVPRTGGRQERERLQVHRRLHMEVGDFEGIPCTSPKQALKDADLAPFELYRALEEADHRYPGSLPLSEIRTLQQRVQGKTRSDAEAQALILMHENGITLPLVNHVVNGIEADFHWPEARLVVEVDGWEFHKERAQFEEDRRRGLVHEAAGFRVMRVSARQVMMQPALLLDALYTTGW